MRWSSHRANGWVPAEPIAYPSGAARAATDARELPQLIAGLRDGPARVGRDLEHRLHELRLDVAVGRRPEQLLDGVDQIERAGVEDHELLLDADGVAGRCEVVIHPAGQLCDSGARTPCTGFPAASHW